MRHYIIVHVRLGASRVSKSYVPFSFTCKFPMVMHFVPILTGDAGQKSEKTIFMFLVTTKLI